MYKELMIRYDGSEGKTLPDGRIMEWAERLAERFNRGPLNCGEFVSNAAMVDAIRLLIAKGVLDHEEVVFRYEGKDIRPNRYGMIVHWPKGFCDSRDNILEELLIASIKIQKEEKDAIKG